MQAGRYAAALDYFQRALPLTPNYSVLEVNHGIVNGALNRDAERHFAQAVEFEPREAVPRFFYARSLDQKGRLPEAVVHLKIAVENNPNYIDSTHLLLQAYAAEGDRTSLEVLATETLARFPSDRDAPILACNGRHAGDYSSRSAHCREPFKPVSGVLSGGQIPGLDRRAARGIEAETRLCRWNNIGAAYNSLSDSSNGIAACEQALPLISDYQIARNNLLGPGLIRMPPPAVQNRLCNFGTLTCCASCDRQRSRRRRGPSAE